MSSALGEIDARRYQVRQAYIGEYESLVVHLSTLVIPADPALNDCRLSNLLSVQLSQGSNQMLLSVSAWAVLMFGNVATHQTPVLPRLCHSTTPLRPDASYKLPQRRWIQDGTFPSRQAAVLLRIYALADPFRSLQVKQPHDSTKPWWSPTGRTSCQENGRTSYC
ncbi:uncharacterized protein M421DRAFT_187306 [Didymella exigua CBS 183.55]|uniref:Uncharacterized protein n=1 Tax=Didymella exigua CBS 183.55 TaxID=1150837 RepID=A0A6A5RKN2_9PLEO|nr:uncharacterized protein M421DRAFT_187306 [Didymella exigua CBS 183.55]KAF1926946.1 hypothetical protein M421DRAFT_187306 [Didymella exigua CBS 183.55]